MPYMGLRSLTQIKRAGEMLAGFLPWKACDPEDGFTESVGKLACFSLALPTHL